MRRNDSAGVACPLREAMAASVGTSVERLARLPVIEVAMRLVNAMDVDVDDDSIRFGIGPAFERRAIEDPAASSSPPFTTFFQSARGGGRRHSGGHARDAGGEPAAIVASSRGAQARVRGAAAAAVATDAARGIAG
ncbi:hypothetical protein PINS_up023840 [Pythium insidiosum]|nr:hypothetical protein PINS_up023840 [Pythium insidiosum]